MQLQLSIRRALHAREVVFLFLNFLSLQDLHLYGLSCKAGYEAVKDYFQWFYNFKQLLARFIPVPCVAHLSRVHLLASLEGMGCSVIDANFGGGKHVHKKHPDVRPGMSRIITLVSLLKRKVQIMVTCVRPVNTILEYHSTALMNFLSCDYAYSLYAWETLQEGLALYSLSANTHVRQAAKTKYDVRGWKTVTDEVRAQALQVFAPAACYVGNKETWIMYLGCHGLGDGYLRDASWDLAYNLSGDALIFPS
ncbi:hypothetical protein BDN71DRAFT_1428244 [Pleurotus eryngii]|uniref:Uncharacterized protein n=1 Tax=Pleurotus eryngii TaxID=5323 RepID=A0A9P6A409_PLEER|nr:hypothetical protein BDN71DRAFT_1428244 [Pleurotus eryngii]